MATSADYELLRTRLTCFFLLLLFLPLTGILVTPSSAVASQPTLRVLVALFFCSLCLPLSQPHSIGISQDSVALRSEVSVLILDMLDLRAKRSVVRATTPEDDLKTNLNSVEFPLCSRDTYLHHTASSTTTLPSRYTDQNNKPSSAAMRNNAKDRARSAPVSRHRQTGFHRRLPLD